ncbi:hypothetical protein NW759_007507 [Fusarium solani]|nr:hypothetical protein NW759_007507 [Fusarium solani]
MLGHHLRPSCRVMSWLSSSAQRNLGLEAETRAFGCPKAKIQTCYTKSRPQEKDKGAHERNKRKKNRPTVFEKRRGYRPNSVEVEVKVDTHQLPLLPQRHLAMRTAVARAGQA